MGLSSKKSFAPISSTTSIIDLADVSIGSLWKWKSHLQQASALATANYPETLGSIAIVNAPSFFPTVWGWIKVCCISLSTVEVPLKPRIKQNWFDEGTTSKITIMSADMSPLRKLITPENLPRAYGGEFEWTFQDEPALDQPAKDILGEMPQGPIIWQGMVQKP